MLRQESMSARMAKIAIQIDERGGSVDEDELCRIMRGFGVVRQAASYKKALVEYGYLDYARGTYSLTEESKMSATITVTVTPSLFAEEVRWHIADNLVGYPDLIGVSDVEL